MAVEEAHYRQIREHGGAHGLRDDDALESALARARNRWTYEPVSTMAELAAAYAFGLARNHPFVDGNKRIALVSLVAFLDLNGIELTAADAEAVEMMLDLASGRMTEPEVAAWIASHAREA